MGMGRGMWRRMGECNPRAPMHTNCLGLDVDRGVAPACVSKLSPTQGAPVSNSPLIGIIHI